MTARGGVVWITGLSAAGKSTVGASVVRGLRARGHAALLLDGGDVRAAVDDPAVAHDLRSRLVNAWRIARLARLVAEQDTVGVVATMSLFHVVHAWNRAHLPQYLEVLLRAAPETRMRRDPHGLYARAARGESRDVVGVDLEPEWPERPDLDLNNDGPMTGIDALAAQIVAAWLARAAA